ncbi:MAG TPA: DUF2252 family protein [Myxococcales bacterium]|jgi:uncharacterized protein (DUF2252 family)
MPVSATSHRTHVSTKKAEASEPKKVKQEKAQQEKGSPKASTPAKSGDVLEPATKSRADEVRKALLADNRDLIVTNPTGARSKFQKLTTSPFVFFRGTAGLFYRDLKGVDAGQPKVLCNGDVHPENFGAIQGQDGKLFFGLNDFDESMAAPFGWDLRRGATAFELAARDSGIPAAKRQKITEAFLEGYQDAMKGFAGADGEKDARIDSRNAPKVVGKLLEKAEKQARKEFLGERVDLKKGKFLDTADIKPLPARVDEFAAALKSYRSEMGLSKDFLKVKDVAAKLESGTASLGSERYYVLVEGKSKSAEDDVILEIKQERPSALEPYTGTTDKRPAAERVAANEEIQSPGGDPYYGAIKLGGQSFLVRERNPHKAAVDLTKLDAGDYKDYARACGVALAQAHARSDKKDGFASDKDLVRALDRGLSKEVARFASEEADRVTSDYQAFKTGFEKGQFGFGR